MADLVALIQDGAREAQAQRQMPAVGELWWRGRAFMFITRSDRAGVAWVSEASGRGVQRTATRREWFELAVDRVDAEIEEGDYLVHAWMIASASAVAAATRITVLTRTVRRAPDDDAKVTVAGWIAALQRGREPRR